jgi:hypothetical protein
MRLFFVLFSFWQSFLFSFGYLIIYSTKTSYPKRKLTAIYFFIELQEKSLTFTFYGLTKKANGSQFIYYFTKTKYGLISVELT